MTSRACTLAKNAEPKTRPHYDVPWLARLLRLCMSEVDYNNVGSADVAGMRCGV
jgi:hypothetical protein